MIPRDLVLTPESRQPLKLPEFSLEQILSRPVPEGLEFPAADDGNREVARSSIIVVSFNNLAFTRLCLESVLSNTPGSSFELIVVDNGSDDGSREYLAELSRLNDNVRLQLNGQNLGFAKACNQGLSLARHEILVLLNNDTIVPPGWLSGLVRGLQRHDAGLVGPVTNRCGNEAEVEVSYRTYGGMLDYAERRATDYKGQTSELRMLTMFCVAVARKIYQQIGQLDESFEIGFFEDEDYSMRLKCAGYRLICMEDVFVHHFGQASFGKLAASGMYGELFHANRRRFEAKWGIRWEPHAHRVKSGYRRLVAATRKHIESRTPFNSTVAVASRGDEDLVAFSGRTGWHMPQEKDGTYSGHHPADGREAITAIENCRIKGAEYFVLPSPMFWWLQFYEGLAAHLSERYDLLVDDGACLVFDLAGLTEDRALPVYGPDVLDYRGIDGLTRKLVTVVYLLEETGSRTREFLRDLAERVSLPIHLLIIDSGRHEKGHDRYLHDLADRFPHVALVRTARRVGPAAAARLGCSLALGDVVLCSDSEKPGVAALEDLCLYGSGDEMLATAGDNQAVFITRKALREAGPIGAGPESSWSEMIDEFRRRTRSLGFSHHPHPTRGPSGPEALKDSRPVLLAMVHSGRGGARYSAEDVLKGLADSCQCLLLETGPEYWYLFKVAHNRLSMIRHDRFTEAWSIESGIGDERLKALSHICKVYSVGLVNIHHLMGSGPEAIDLFSRLRIPVIFTFHDQYALCPTSHLVDDKGSFCGGVCSEGDGDCPLNPAYFGNMESTLKHGFVFRHRERMDAALKKCQGFVFPSYSTKRRLTAIFDFLAHRQVEIVEHGRDLPFTQVATRPKPTEAARVVCMGAINRQKGADLILALAHLNSLGNQRFELHFLGSRPPGFVPEKYGGVYHGSYSREGLQPLLEEIAPSFSLLAPVCEETFSFTLTESWASGIPVFASDRGALRERITRHGGGWLIEPENADAFFEGMVKVLDCPGEWDRQVGLIRKIPQIGVADECRQLNRYFQNILAGSQNP